MGVRLWVTQFSIPSAFFKLFYVFQNLSRCLWNVFFRRSPPHPSPQLPSCLSYHPSLHSYNEASLPFALLPSISVCFFISPDKTAIWGFCSYKARSVRCEQMFFFSFFSSPCWAETAAQSPGPAVCAAGHWSLSWTSGLSQCWWLLPWTGR